MLFTLIKPRDTLELFYVRPGGHESNRDMQYIDYLKAYYEKELAEQGPYNAAFNMIKKEDKESLSDCIVRYVSSHGACCEQCQLQPDDWNELRH